MEEKKKKWREESEREKVINKILQLIVDEMEEPGKGNLTTEYTIGILEEAIGTLEGRSQSLSVKQCFNYRGKSLATSSEAES